MGAAIALFVFWGNGWLFREEFWGIDDPTRFVVMREANEAFRAGGLAAWWNALLGAHGNNYGPAMALCQSFTCLWFGASRVWPYHLLKGLQFALFIYLLWAAARNLGGGRFGAAIAVFLAVFANSTRYLPDMQSYSANWWRLYTTDSFGALPMVVFWWAVSSATLSKNKRTALVLLVLSCFSYSAAIIAKANFIFLLPAVITGFALATAGGAFGRRDLRWLIPFAAALLLLGALAFPVYKVNPAGEMKVRMYETQQASFAWSALSQGLNYYSALLEESGAWLWWIAPAWAAVAIPGLIRRRRSARPRRAWRETILLTALAAGIGGLILQSAWPIRIPRYAPLVSPPAWRWRGWRHRAGAALISGFIAISILSQIPVMGWNYAEARAAFRVFYRGQNELKAGLRELPRSEEKPYTLWSNVTGEFMLSTLWFLETCEARADYAWTRDEKPPAAFSPPAAVHILNYPHPPHAALWAPEGSGEWRFTPWMATGSKVIALLPLGAGDPPIRIDLPVSERPERLGRLILRFDMRTLPWNRTLRTVVADEQGGRIAEAVLPGLEVPRQNTNRAPVILDPPALLEAGKRYHLLISIERAPEAEASPLARWFLREDKKTLFLRMEPPPGSSFKTPQAGVEFFRAEPWDPALEILEIQNRSVSERTLHIEAPAAIIRRILENKGYGYSTQAVRWIQYTVRSATVRLGAARPSPAQPPADSM